MLRWLPLFLLLLFPSTAVAGLKVAVSIRPVHSLVCSLMQGIATPELVIAAGGSPHTYNLRPSEVRLLHHADLIVWVGPELEAVLSRPLAGRQPGPGTLNLLDALPAAAILPARHGGDWSGSDPHPSEGHKHGEVDPHLWLSPANAAAASTVIAARLVELDTANRDLYQRNLTALLKRLDELARRTEVRLAPYRKQQYLVFHDAYQYFEREFGLRPAGALAVDPDRPPGARRLVEIRESIRNQAISCLFTEPQFEPRLVKVLAEGTGIRVGTLDPIGAELAPGRELYFELITAMATALESCLAGKEQPDGQ